ncbi:Sec-independent protein translocase subunit TatA [Mycolicibacterium sp. CH28]|uniref:Sec-independent protein translocase subunit TatA n=1 Tax=Mycolicibacterium sp. CH28 TaxID=2512237 RepID=UPI001081D0F0|nr:Sec-independent protein translocase subunit TatA [Mycolicibacterium sp. CH28]TGD86381.1 Sec-independent protein translocase subunit TatA [Mycolicibacterium sp. CH28]
MGALQPWHWLILIAVVVLLFGSKRLPDAARSLGKSMRIFKSEVKELQNDNKADSPVAPVQPPTQVQSERVEAPVTPPVAPNHSDAKPA